VKEDPRLPRKPIVVNRDNDRSRPLDPFRPEKPNWYPGSDEIAWF
jgi:hypothetical protein